MRKQRDTEEKTIDDLFKPYSGSPWTLVYELGERLSTKELKRQFWVDYDGKPVKTNDMKFLDICPMGKFRYIGDIDSEGDLVRKTLDPENDIPLDLITFQFEKYIVGGREGHLEFVQTGPSKKYPDYVLFRPIPALKLYWDKKQTFRWGYDYHYYPEFVRTLGLEDKRDVINQL
ncbi:MAG: hypothetical protein ACM3X9_02885 [Bacillota bacterium]